MLNIKFTINDVLLNQEYLKNKNKYSCQICFEFIYKKSIYQCKSGHSACKECWEKSLERKKECMTCRCEVKSIIELSRSSVIEQDFGKKECCCIYSFTDEIVKEKYILFFGESPNKRILNKDEINGCKEIIMVDEIDSHFQKCKFKFVSCQNNGCNKAVRFHSSEEHKEQCGFKLVPCQYCKTDEITKNQLVNHYDEYPKVSIDCPQGCSMKIERDQILSHKENHCKYFEYGCKAQMKRSDLQYHFVNVNHQIFMGNLIDTITKINKTYISKKVFSNSLKFFPHSYKNKWIISEFSKVAKELEFPKKFKSPVFSINSSQFFISIYPNGCEKENETGIFLNLQDFKEPINIEYYLKLVNILDKSKSILKNANTTYTKDHHSWGWDTFVDTKQINIKNGWLSNDDKLIIKVYAKILNIKPLES
ncbi:hypothetical protein ACTA71_000149 [Dictyostelium dimigraforme]